jgi:FlaA1/EpsC-like NDP-sugar epimerase
MIRYFMTIPEAVGLVLTAGTFAQGGEIFVLDMGRPVKIYALAVDLIRLSGYEPETDIKIQVTGLRPGEKLEKLYEELFLGDETVDETTHKKIFVLKSSDIERFEQRLDDVMDIAAEGQDESALREAVFSLAGGL